MILLSGITPLITEPGGAAAYIYIYIYIYIYTSTTTTITTTTTTTITHISTTTTTTNMYVVRHICSREVQLQRRLEEHLESYCIIVYFTIV